MSPWAERRPLIAGNWKMHKTIAEAEQMIQAVLPRVSTADGVEVAICPAFSAAGSFSDSALSVSPNIARRSECPSTTPWTSISLSIGGDTSPVKAPSLS